MASLGLGYPALRAINPKIVLASLSSQGETGPEADRVSFGSTLEATGGLAWFTGYAGGPPTMSGIALNYADQVVAIFAAGMILTTLIDRRRHGSGSHLEVSQRELISFLCGESFLVRETEPRRGNAEDPWPLQDCFRALDGRWIAVSVAGSALSSLEALIGHGGGGDLGAGLRAWIGGRGAEAALSGLAAAGVTCAPVLNGAEALARNEQLQAEAVSRAEDGKLLKGFPFTLDSMKPRIDADARSLGADTRQIMTELAGYSAEEVSRLVRDGIVELPA
jgi:formyl-CoA transferase